MKVTKTKFAAGLWHGEVSDATSEPDLHVTLLGREVPDVSLTPTDAKTTWTLKVPIPQSAIADGIQTIVISDTATGKALGQITIAAGEALSEDLRAEVDLMRAELDLLKAAFRRHCADTG